VLCSEIHRLIYSIQNKEQLPEQWKESIIVLFMKRMIKVTSNYGWISLV
jgi:hypothetical protein